jgi:Electron transfer DM13
MPSSLANASETVLASGSFHSVAHDSEGMVSIYQLGNGKRVLRFTDFQTSNGPDVRVYLVAANDARDWRTLRDTARHAGIRSYELARLPART